MSFPAIITSNIKYCVTPSNRSQDLSVIKKSEIVRKRAPPVEQFPPKLLDFQNQRLAKMQLPIKLQEILCKCSRITIPTMFFSHAKVTQITG